MDAKGARLGDQVVVRVNPMFNNGATEAPGTVTRVLGAPVETDGVTVQSVNVHVLRDGPNTEHLTQVPLFASEADANEDGAATAAWPLGTSLDPDADDDADDPDPAAKPADPKTDPAKTDPKAKV